MKSEIRIIIEPKHITYVSRIMEGYEYLGVVTTIDRSAGILLIRSTPDMHNEAKVVLSSLPIRLEFLD